MGKDFFRISYCEPTVLWRLRHEDGRHAHGKIIPRLHDASAVWFINDLPEAAQDFEDGATAVKWLEEVRSTLERNGWGRERAG